MSDNVVRFGGTTTLPIPVARVLQSDEALALEEALVLGWTKERGFYIAGSEADMRKHLMLAVLAQRWITDQYDLNLT